MNCFVDTSAFYALLDADDRQHVTIRAGWEKLLKGGGTPVTTSAVLTETMALLQHRLGLAATRAFHEDVYPILRVEWVDVIEHEAGVNAVLSALRRDLSLVDCISFFVMRRLGIRQVLACDAHFAEQGFAPI